jgi:hypothetical protein
MKHLTYAELFESNPAQNPSRIWRNLVRLISSRFFVDAGAHTSTLKAELASARAQLAILQRDNLQIQRQLAAATSPAAFAQLMQLAYTDCLTDLWINRSVLVFVAYTLAFF